MHETIVSRKKHSDENFPRLQCFFSHSSGRKSRNCQIIHSQTIKHLTTSSSSNRIFLARVCAFLYIIYSRRIATIANFYYLCIGNTYLPITSNPIRHHEQHYPHHPLRSPRRSHRHCRPCTTAVRRTQRCLRRILQNGRRR